ncbi:MAG: protein translocase subunit SecF [Synergistaceae bacterium]|jgi:preprotein translocase subunit SecF|nr:protein translocase subunit SecF [Synergistaceae bacterium]
MTLFDASKLNLSLMKYRKFAMILSIAAIIVSLVSLSVKGVNYSVDFSGGVALQLAFDPPPEDVGEIRNVLADIGHSQATIQAYDDGSILIRYQDSTAAAQRSILEALRDRFGEVTVRKIDNVGPVVGQELRRQAAVAISLSILAILAYMAVRFRFRFGVAAVAALIHDSIIMLGAYSLTGREISTSFIAAILTVIGYSLNDTIVVMDRVRENWNKLHRDGIVTLVNDSVNQTMSRTINTSLTTLLPVLTMFFLGGEVISNLAFAFLIGIVVGTYSSIYIASSIVVEWYLRKPVRS